jgi:uncharacterized repeat protein (TIGR03806 family)
MRRAVLALIGSVLLACGSEETPPEQPPVLVTPAPPGEPWETLEEWHLFADPIRQRPAQRVVPYDVIAPLYSDRTAKYRFIVVPEGEVIGYSSHSTWDFPVGTVLVKTFSYPFDERDVQGGERLLETRLLVHEPDRWTPHTYVWNEEQTEARRVIDGGTIAFDWTDTEGRARHNDYGVPTTTMCHDCHGGDVRLDTLGGRTRQLDRDFDYGGRPKNQIDHLAELGLFDSVPPAMDERQRLDDPWGTAALDTRARSYLDANCGHCHTLGGSATQSGLLLSWPDTDPTVNAPTSFGVCKTPTATGGACGLAFDIVPGTPEQSMLICRIASSEPQVRMPPVATKLPHDEGIALLEEWIMGMSPVGCGN